MIKVLVVDDSAVLRRLISTVLARDPDIEVIGTASDGLEAIEAVDRLAPDVVTLDVEMPRLDGLGAVERISKAHPRLPVIMFSTLTERGARATLQALSLGASDYVAKPTGSGNVAEAMDRVRDDLVPRVKALAGARRIVATPAVTTRARPVSAATPRLLVVASSTGGPDALCTLFAALPASLPVPVLVAQHMPPVFTRQLADRLDRVSPLRVREAAQDDPLRAGEVLVAPGDWHLRVAPGGGHVVQDQGPRENFCRPAADPLLRSAAAAYGAGVVAVVLTGMGQDGLLGCRDVAAAGGTVIVQDQASSVVWGMPGAVAQDGLAHAILPLASLAPHVLGLVGPRSAGVALTR